MKYQKDVFRNFTLIIQFGINMLVPILLCMFFGMFLDKLFHTSFIVIVMFFLGAAAGFRNIFVFAKRSSGKKSYLGSDSDRIIDELSRGQGDKKKEDFAEKMDRLYRENMNE